MYNLEEIFKNGPEDIQERMDIIANTVDAIIKVQNELQARGYWCKSCGRWYYKDDCGMRSQRRTYTICTNPFQGYLDDYEYEERTDTEYYDICPEGHQISSKPRLIC